MTGVLRDPQLLRRTPEDEGQWTRNAMIAAFGAAVCGHPRDSVF